MVSRYQDHKAIEATTLGRIASYYYIHHSSVRQFRDAMSADTGIPDLIGILSVSSGSSRDPGSKFTPNQIWVGMELIIPDMIRILAVNWHFVNG